MNFERIEQLVHDALARPESERALFLEESCAGDAELRREVESLLRHAGSAADAFESSALEWTEVLSLVESERSRADHDDELGTRIGPYRLIEKIGSGGMGNVYRAVRDDREFEQTVAIKRIKRGLDTDEILDRFRRERQVLANLIHPNIARLLDGGSTGDGRPYLVLEYVEGKRIDDYCDERRLTVSQRLELFRVVCDAVQFAHRNLVIHRDLKPGNILVELTEQDARPRPLSRGERGVKIIDFGIAKLLSPEEPDATLSMTTERGPRLTPAYASPEQATGGTVTTSSDVYALGVILYELLTGVRPYRIEGASQREAERIIRESPPKSVRAALEEHGDGLKRVCAARSTDAARLRRELAGDLEKVLLKALQKDPGRRYASVEAFSDDLLRVLEGRPVRARRDSAAYRLRKFVGRNRVGVSAAAALVILLAAATVVSTASFFGAREARRRAEHQTQTAQAINAFLTDMLASVDPRIEGVDVTVREVLDQAAARADTEFADFPEVEQGVQSAVGRAYRALGLYDDALPHLERALGLSLEVHGGDHPRAAEAMGELGLLLRQMGRYADAEALHREALEIDRRHAGASSLEAARSMNDLAQVLYDQGRFDEGRPLYLRSFAIRSERLGEQSADFVASLNNLARARYTEGDYAEAEMLLRETLHLARELYGEQHPDTIGQMNNVAFMAMMRGRYDEAAAIFRDAIELYENEYGPSHPDIARALNNLGECLRRQGTLEEAEAVHRDALAMRRAALGDDHPLVAVSLNNLGLTLAELDRYDEALPIHQEALKIRRSQLGERHPNVATTLGSLGWLLRKMGRLDDARARLREALDIRLEAYDESHPLVANSKMNLAHCLTDLGELEAGETLCREALRAQEQSLDAGHPHTAATRALLGRILLRRGRLEEAETLLLAAHESMRSQRDDAGSDAAQVAQDLAAVYEQWGRPEAAEAWRAGPHGVPDHAAGDGRSSAGDG